MHTSGDLEVVAMSMFENSASTCRGIKFSIVIFKKEKGSS